VPKGSRGSKRFIDKLLGRLRSRVEAERWKLLAQQESVIKDYNCIVEELRVSDKQISRLVGPLPDRSICPECHYLQGSSVALALAEEEDRYGGNIRRCPDCGLLVLPS
jgi:hypothetical protein